MVKNESRPVRTDKTLLVLVLLLVIFGLVILFSASAYNGRVRFHDPSRIVAMSFCEPRS